MEHPTAAARTRQAQARPARRRRPRPPSARQPRQVRHGGGALDHSRSSTTGSSSSTACIPRRRRFFRRPRVDVLRRGQGIGVDRVLSVLGGVLGCSRRCGRGSRRRRPGIVRYTATVSADSGSAYSALGSSPGCFGVQGGARLRGFHLVGGDLVAALLLGDDRGSRRYGRSGSPPVVRRPRTALRRLATVPLDQRGSDSSVARASGSATGSAGCCPRSSRFASRSGLHQAVPSLHCPAGAGEMMPSRSATGISVPIQRQCSHARPARRRAPACDLRRPFGADLPARRGPRGHP